MTAIADTGFLVAILNARDEHNAWAAGLARQISEPVLTCEAVLTEAAYLLNDSALVTEAKPRWKIARVRGISKP